MNELRQKDCVQLLADIADAMRHYIEQFTDRSTLLCIEESIVQARNAAKGKLPCLDLRELSTIATQLTGTLELYSHGLFPDDPDRKSHLSQLTFEQMRLVRDVADVAARSLRAATGNKINANIECGEGLGWAYDFAQRLGNDMLRRRIQSLVDHATPNS